MKLITLALSITAFSANANQFLKQHPILVHQCDTYASQTRESLGINVATHIFQTCLYGIEDGLKHDDIVKAAVERKFKESLQGLSGVPAYIQHSYSNAYKHGYQIGANKK